jgi:membrane associated rhomboid family serine protease
LVLLAVLVAVHVIRNLLPGDLDAWFVFASAFIPARYGPMGSELPGGQPALFTSPVTHMFVHGDIVHLTLNSAWLLAFGGAIVERSGGLRFLAFSLVCGLAGAATFYIVNPSLMQPVVGASGAISGMMAATLRFLFPAMDCGGLRRLREAPRSVRLMNLAETLTDRRIILTSGVLVVINVLAVFGFGGAQNGAGIAWEAHLGGYVMGLLTYGLFDAIPEGEVQEQPNS